MPIAVREKGALVRPLRILVPLIKDELMAGDRAGLDHYRSAGALLIEAKEHVQQGEWQAWLKRNFHLSSATARDYMKLAEKRSALHFSTLAEAVRPNREPGHRPTWHAPVREVTARVDVDKLAEERQSRAKEQKLIHDLAYQLIDIGYKVLATKLHPDKGGSKDAMARLNRARNILRSAI